MRVEKNLTPNYKIVSNMDMEGRANVHPRYFLGLGKTEFLNHDQLKLRAVG